MWGGYGVVEDDEGGVAAQLHAALLDLRRALPEQQRPHLVAAKPRVERRGGPGRLRLPTHWLWRVACLP